MRGADVVARIVITAGGIGTIIAVLLVCVFLLAVAMPLFRAARVEKAGVARLSPADASGDRTAIHCGADESGQVGFLLDSDGGVAIFSTAGGGLLLEKSPKETGLSGVTAVRIALGGIDGVVGFEDGSHCTARIGLESSFLAAADLPRGLRDVAVGVATVHEGDVILQASRGQFVSIRMIVELDERVPSKTQAAVIDADLTKTSGGPVVAILDANGVVRLEKVATKRNLLTDEVVRTTVSGEILPDDPAAGAPAALPRFVRLSELGDQALIVAADGSSRRYGIRAIDSPRWLETVDVAPGEAGVTAVARLFGGSAIAVGDDRGGVSIYFATRGREGVRSGASAGPPPATASDGFTLVMARTFPAPQPSVGAAVTAIAASPRSRLFAASHASGVVQLLHSTTRRSVISVGPSGSGRVTSSAIAPRENLLLAGDGSAMAAWAFDAGYPEITFGSLFGSMWYEQYPGPVHAWETTGHDSFEPKFGLVPLVFGTIKATLYSMLFATPIAILAAIYSSQFMHPVWKARVKPAIEMMASLPSVVLGFIAGLVFAPLLEGSVMGFLSALFTVPLAIVTGAHLWQLIPAGLRARIARYRFPIVLFVAIPAGVSLAWLLAKPLESLLFDGDLQAWLDGQGGSGFGGWVITLLPLSAIAVTLAVGRIVSPAIRRRSSSWSVRRAAVVSLGTFAIGVVMVVALAVAAAVLLDALRLDTRGGLFGTYVQRNALVVAVGMGFAIIPLIFTIADDALSSVPEHLRSASLGAGATPWQTAVRVTVPAAASGLFSAAMIGLGRAVGETMIVLMAAGNTPLINWNVFNGFQTLSAAIATELPEAARGTAHYRILFLAALTLFVITFVVNTLAEVVRQRVRRRAHEL